MTEQPPRSIKEKIDFNFRHHAPRNKGVEAAHDAIRASLRECCEEVLDYVAPGPELEEGLKRMREAMMWFNAGIAVNSSDNSSTDGKLVVDEP